jgi:glutamate-1-semialdehyde 2,1-aminomutase
MKLGYGGVFQGGTYTGNVVSTAAADATLELIQSGKVFEQINRHGGMLQTGIKEICRRHSVPVVINGAPGMFGVCFAEEAPRDWRELKTKPNWEMSDVVYDHMIDNGVMPEAGGIEPFFISMSHTDADGEEMLERFEEGVVLAKG